MTGTDLERQICMNEKCSDYSKRNPDNIIKKGFNAKGNQMFKCKTCGTRFPGTIGTIFYNRHFSEEDIISICKLLAKEKSTTAIAHEVELHRVTVSSIIKYIAAHPKEVSDFLRTNAGLSQIEINEMWYFIGRKKWVDNEMWDEILNEIHIPMSPSINYEIRETIIPSSISKRHFIRDNKETISALQEVGLKREVAVVLTFLDKANEATSHNIEGYCRIKQPDVSRALKELNERGWINEKKTLQLQKKNPIYYHTKLYNVYSLKISFTEIIAKIEQEKVTSESAKQSD